MSLYDIYHNAVMWALLSLSQSCHSVVPHEFLSTQSNQSGPDLADNRVEESIVVSGGDGRRNQVGESIVNAGGSMIQTLFDDRLKLIESRDSLLESNLSRTFLV